MCGFKSPFWCLVFSQIDSYAYYLPFNGYPLKVQFVNRYLTSVLMEVERIAWFSQAMKQVILESGLCPPATLTDDQMSNKLSLGH